jgi:hypothetical protein
VIEAGTGLLRKSRQVNTISSRSYSAGRVRLQFATIVYGNLERCWQQGAAQSLEIETLRSCLFSDDGKDVAEYAVMVAGILLIVAGNIRLIGSNCNTVFSAVECRTGTITWE